MESIVEEAEIYFIPKYLSKDIADKYFQDLNNGQFRIQPLYFRNRNDPSIIDKVMRSRPSYWFGDYPQATQGVERDIPTDFVYNYPFTPEMLALKKNIEVLFDMEFNSCLVGKFESPQDKIGFHSDASEAMGSNPYVASLSLGKSRRFLIKHKNTSERLELNLEHGDLLIMKDNSNVNYLHSVPKDAYCSAENCRINLTFRNYTYHEKEKAFNWKEV